MSNNVENIPSDMWRAQRCLESPTYPHSLTTLKDPASLLPALRNIASMAIENVPSHHENTPV